MEYAESPQGYSINGLLATQNYAVAAGTMLSDLYYVNTETNWPDRFVRLTSNDPNVWITHVAYNPATEICTITFNAAAPWVGVRFFK